MLTKAITIHCSIHLRPDFFHKFYELAQAAFVNTVCCHFSSYWHREQQKC